MAEYSITAVERTLDVLAVFERGPESMCLADLARETGINKTTLLRICSSLERRSYLRRDALGRYRLGPAAYTLGKRYEADVHLDDAVIPALVQLSATVRESSSFHVRSGSIRLCLYRVDAAQTVLDNIKTGDRLPLDRGAPGRVLLAFEGCQGKSHEETRNKGFALSFGDRDPHCAAVAVPVFKYPRELCGALSVSGPQTRFTTRYAQRILPQVIAAAEHLSRSLGAQSSPAKRSSAALRRAA